MIDSNLLFSAWGIFWKLINMRLLKEEVARSDFEDWKLWKSGFLFEIKNYWKQNFFHVGKYIFHMWPWTHLDIRRVNFSLHLCNAWSSQCIWGENDAEHFQLNYEPHWFNSSETINYSRARGKLYLHFEFSLVCFFYLMLWYVFKKRKLK